MLADPTEDIRGSRVHDQDGEEVGKIDDLLVDEDEGTVRMVRIEEGGFLGIGSPPFFLPVDAITSIADGEVHVDQTRSHVAEAPRYDPDLTDQSDYYSELCDYYGYARYLGAGLHLRRHAVRRPDVRTPAAIEAEHLTRARRSACR
jgi:sporulation protein YlmC with PRC-barrel domain